MSDLKRLYLEQQARSLGLKFDLSELDELDNDTERLAVLMELVRRQQNREHILFLDRPKANKPVTFGRRTRPPIND
jgi:ABC-type transporter Mla MlaB component